MDSRDAVDDARLVERVRSGDRLSYDALIGRHAAVAYRVAARIVGRDEADDVCQDAFVRAYYRIDQYSGEGSFRSWLLQVTRSVALNSLRKQRPDATAEIELIAGADHSPGAPRPASVLEQKEQRERLELKMSRLSEDHRSVLVLRDLEGLSYEEISQVNEIPIGTVKGRLHRARAEMIDLLRHNTYDWDLPAE